MEAGKGWPCAWGMLGWGRAALRPGGTLVSVSLGGGLALMGEGLAPSQLGLERAAALGCVSP